MSRPDLRDPHHDGSARFVDPGPYRLGGTAGLRVLVPDLADGRDGADRVVLRSLRDGEPALTPARAGGRTAGGRWWHVALPLTNPVTSYRFFLGGPDGAYRWLNAEGVHARDTSDGADFLLRVDHAPPDWVADEVAYQIFPDRFARSSPDTAPPAWAREAAWDEPVIGSGPGVERQWYGGDLDGVAAHLDHVVALGAGVLYLTPMFEGRSNHRYDAVTFDRIDPALGGDDALLRLIAAAHARGLRVLGDLTTNHTGREHEWFLAAQAEADSPEAAFYSFTEHPHEYVSWLDVPSLPKLDHTSTELRRRLYRGADSVVGRWTAAGLDGWRIDVANMTGRLGADDLTHEVAREIRATMHAVDPDAWLLAEHGHDAGADLSGDGWDGTMDYQGFTRPLWTWLNGGAPGAGTGGSDAVEHGLHFLGLPVDIPVLPAHAITRTMREVHAAMPWSALAASTLHLSSHDTPRFRTVAGGGVKGGVDHDGAGRDLHLLALALQMTMPGVPSVFAGDEIGLTGTNGEHARTPFPWDPAAWDGATWEDYRAWIALRREHVALRRGGLRWAHVGVDSLTYLREHAEQRLLVHVARADGEDVRLPLELLGGAEPTVLRGEAPRVAGDAVVLPARRGALVWELALDAGWGAAAPP
ncbi:glycoside hydrolase family 13 protein [Litorihabitans aurantiacus]|uniref:Alpha-glycosidase n=1 Tax=Litorihabitans aurantiacus TaxID=1930061 RepID=A0AA37UN17_9MICO|nr:glycoside hydrolase family 13 protein [Litorihabitans aurantiacus]GMA30994.1 alpha-glycosidase [Litorihabitans aurantiacus]